jgi:hypothetical protein
MSKKSKQKIADLEARLTLCGDRIKARDEAVERRDRTIKSLHEVLNAYAEFRQTVVSANDKLVKTLYYGDGDQKTVDSFVANTADLADAIEADERAEWTSVADGTSARDILDVIFPGARFKVGGRVVHVSEIQFEGPWGEHGPNVTVKLET